MRKKSLNILLGFKCNVFFSEECITVRASYFTSKGSFFNAFRAEASWFCHVNIISLTCLTYNLRSQVLFGQKQYRQSNITLMSNYLMVPTPSL